ncbi:helix-turn-helix transcriptional regulator [Natronomonas salina]|uniref:helix-turn-helix transcriptional regulator n=1 Tax=Natronomonas salina TaxID=1710540 RepID=UPI0015B3F2C9|nr:helix-turn-helix transcriptional regulator [Natronomonas salina]QLD87615.1 helix-turn-helix transcriptional regulator [Natronomonas salina]
MPAEGESGTSIEQLYQELTEVESSGSASSDPSHRSAEIVETVTEQLFPDWTSRFDEDLVKYSLDELLLVLILLRDGETHGKGLMADLSDLFDARLSPGTVYPRLHDLEEDDVLEMHELVRTKEYRIEDHDEVRARLETAMTQHLALGFIFSEALEEF